MPIEVRRREGDMELDDAALVGACRRGETAAWEQIIQRYQRLVYSIPRRAGLDADETADVFQEVFAKLVEHLDRLEHPERLHSWLVTTARRESWRVGQRRGSRQLAGGEAVMQAAEATVADPGLLPDEAVERLEQRHLVRTALAGLDPRCQRLLTQLYIVPDPLSYAALASLIGIPLGSIGPTRARCLQKLRQALRITGRDVFPDRATPLL